MPRKLYIATSEPRSGKSLVMLGVMELLSRRVDRLGFFRPIIRDHDELDNDIELVRTRYALSHPYDSMYGATIEDARRTTADRSADALLKQVLRKYKAMESKCDFVLCEGTDFEGVTTAFEFDFNAQIANHLGCPVLIVVSGNDKSPDEIANAAITTRRAFVEEGCAVTATIVNRVTRTDLGQARTAVDRVWSYDDPVFYIPDEPLFQAPTIGAIAEALDALPLHDGNLDPNQEVLHFAVAAMQLPNFLKRLRDGTLVIAPGDRADILVGCLATLASENYPHVTGMLLTGGLKPAEPVVRLIEGFRRPLLPIYYVDADTYESVKMVMEVGGEITPQNERKVQAALGAFEASVDIDRLEARIDVSRSTVVTPLMFEYELVERAKRSKQHIVLPEGEEERIQRAAEILRRRDVVDITLLGNPGRINDSLTTLGLQMSDVQIVDPRNSDWLEGFAKKFFELRKHKGVTEDMAWDTIQDASYFGTMMVLEGIADGMVSGSVHTTAHTIRPALQVIRTKPGVSIVSSAFLMCLSDRVLVYGDCAVNPNPDPQQLADIAISSAETAKMFGIEPRIAMLSYSTGQSGKGEDVEKVKLATKLARAARPDLMIEGPIQYDAAIDAGVAETKLPDSAVAGRATVFIFPDLNTGNNTYKAVQRSAGAVAIGPVLQGLRRPVNDLSRGCTVTDIVNTIAITAIQAHTEKCAMKSVLVINSGSSSVKYELFDMVKRSSQATGIVERIGEATGRLRHRTRANGTSDELIIEQAIPNHGAGLQLIEQVLAQSRVFDISSLYGIGHRVVHGGEHFDQPTLIDASVMETIKRLIPLAPLHNPANLLGIEIALSAYPHVPQVAVFDTAFHQTLPRHAYHYAIPRTLYDELHIRRYGFHGTSHNFVAKQVASHLGRPFDSLNTIVFHLGNGASAVAIRRGKSVDTSMGLTPLEGLVMGTRCGDLDPAIIFHVGKVSGKSLDELDFVLNNESGLKGICGNNDMREVASRADEGDDLSQLAVDMFCYRIKKYLGAYYAVLGHVDAIAFTAGIGENSAVIRRKSCEGLDNLGIAIDPHKNSAKDRGVREIQAATSTVKVLVVPTDEELEIAEQTVTCIDQQS